MYLCFLLFVFLLSTAGHLELQAPRRLLSDVKDSKLRQPLEQQERQQPDQTNGGQANPNGFFYPYNPNQGRQGVDTETEMESETEMENGQSGFENSYYSHQSNGDPNAFDPDYKPWDPDHEVLKSPKAKSGPEMESETESESENGIPDPQQRPRNPYNPYYPPQPRQPQQGYAPYPGVPAPYQPQPGYAPQYMPPKQKEKTCFENGVEVNCNGAGSDTEAETETETEHESETEDGATITENEQEIEKGNSQQITRETRCFIHGIEIPCPIQGPSQGGPGQTIYAGPGAMPGTETETETETESESESENEPILKKIASAEDPRRAAFYSELFWVGVVLTAFAVTVCITLSVCCRKSSSEVDEPLTLEDIEGTREFSRSNLRLGHNKYLNESEV